MGVPTIKTGPMTVEDFYAFTDTRPDEEKWELIEGEPILNAAPSMLHQRILKNVVVSLAAFERRHGAQWEVLPELGVRVSDWSRPEPDVLIVPKNSPSIDLQGRDSIETIAVFEILSPSTEHRDLHWKRMAYTNLPSLTHYVVIAQDAVDVVAFARDAGFVEQRFRSLRDAVDIPALGISLPLAEIYRDTGLK
jgi:Uma2 family endonuclease